MGHRLRQHRPHDAAGEQHRRGGIYALSFFSGTHNPSVQPRINAEIGTRVVHTITHDLDDGSLGGPYTIQGTAPSGVSYLKVVFRDPSSTRAGAKGDSVCLRKTN